MYKYELLKDLPGAKAGTIFLASDLNRYYSLGKDNENYINQDFVQSYSDWFKFIPNNEYDSLIIDILEDESLDVTPEELKDKLDELIEIAPRINNGFGISKIAEELNNLVRYFNENYEPLEYNG